MNRQILFINRDEWRNWLEKNHDLYNEIWLIYFKKHTNKRSIKQPEAVEEALCYGWIDSIVKRIDDEQYMQKFTPRKDNSIWSDVNKIRVAQLIKDEKMTEHGLKKIKMAKKNGMWTKIQLQENISNIPKEFEIALTENIIAKSNFESLAQSHKKQYIYWIADAKREDTKNRRIAQAMDMLKNNQKLGIV